MKAKTVAALVLLMTLFPFAVTGASASASDDAFVPVEYRLYPAPEGGYVGDTMPFVTEDGTLEL